MKNKTVNMLSGSITKGLLSMTIPIMVMNIMQFLFNIIDMTTLRYLSNESAVGAVGACGSLIALFTSLLIGISAGANVIVAKRIGERNKKRTDKTIITSVLLSLVGGIIIMLIGVILAENFLKTTNCPTSLLEQATLYFRIYFYGIPIMMFYNFCASILRAIGDAKKPMYFLIVGGIAKIVCTILFVAGFGTDVEGVALSTIVSNLIASILAFRALINNKDINGIDLRKIRFDMQELKQILYIGIPAGVQAALYSLANVVITSAVNTFGADATTGVAIANQFDGILYQICYAPSLAVIPYTAQNYGAGYSARVKKIVSRAILITTVFGFTFGLSSAIFSRQLSSIMSSSSTVIDFSCQKMVIISSTYFICGINEVLGGVLKGMGKPLVPTITTMIYLCLLRFIWVYAIFPHYPNLTFLYLVWPIGWLLSIITLLFVYYPIQKKL